MAAAENQRKLLENKEVIEEINRHLWIESEKAGYNIGFEKASEDWLTRFSATWMKYHYPQAQQPVEQAQATSQDEAAAAPKKTRNKRTTVSKTRRASSYMPA